MAREITTATVLPTAISATTLGEGASSLGPVTSAVDIAVDFMDMTNDGRLWARVADVRPDFVPVAGRYAVVGDEGAEPAVAQILSVDIGRGINLKVLDGPAEQHLHLRTER
jgi:hypothetical protein